MRDGISLKRSFRVLLGILPGLVFACCLRTKAARCFCHHSPPGTSARIDLSLKRSDTLQLSLRQAPAILTIECDHGERRVSRPNAVPLTCMTAISPSIISSDPHLSLRGTLDRRRLRQSASLRWAAWSPREGILPPQPINGIADIRRRRRRSL